MRLALALMTEEAGTPEVEAGEVVVEEVALTGEGEDTKSA
jgi:hypothetical protein